MIFTHFLYFIIWVSHHNLYHVNIKKVQFQCSLYSLSSSWIWCCAQKYCPLLVFLLLQLTLPISWSAIHHSLKKVFQTEETRLQSEGCPWFYCYYLVFFPSDTIRFFQYQTCQALVYCWVALQWLDRDSDLQSCFKRIHSEPCWYYFRFNLNSNRIKERKKAGLQ